MRYYKEVRFGNIKLHFTFNWLNVWIACILGIIVYYAGWGIGGLALLSHLELTRD
jgi:hypothetical protein